MAVREPPLLSHRYKLTVEDFSRLDLPLDRHYELIEGVVYEMPPIGPLHATLVRKFHDLLYDHLRGKALVSSQNPVFLEQHSMPQPDVALLRIVDYSKKHPEPEDIFLIIEVAISTLADDHIKLETYARAGIPEVWIVNPESYRIEVYREPTPSGYAVHFDHHPEQPLQCMAFPEANLELAW